MKRDRGGVETKYLVQGPLGHAKSNAESARMNYLKFLENGLTG